MGMVWGDSGMGAGEGTQVRAACEFCATLEPGLVWQFAVMTADVMFWNFQAKPYEALRLSEHCPWEPRVAV